MFFLFFCFLSSYASSANKSMLLSYSNFKPNLQLIINASTKAKAVQPAPRLVTSSRSWIRRFLFLFTGFEQAINLRGKKSNIWICPKENATAAFTKQEAKNTQAINQPFFLLIVFFYIDFVGLNF